MTRLQPMFERADEAERLLRAEIAADALPDADVDRVYVFDLVLHRIELIARQGLALDPYSTADIGYRLDEIGMMIPQSAFEAGDFMLRITVYSDVARQRDFAIKAEFVRGDQKTPANAGMHGKIREFVEPVLPRGKCSETRVMCARIVRRKISNEVASRRTAGSKREGEDA